MKKLTLTLVMLYLICSFSAFGQVIGVETDNSGMYFSVGKNKSLYLHHFGAKIIAGTEDFLLDNEQNTARAKIISTDAYPTFGTGHNNEVALSATHADGNMTTVLRYVSHSKKEISAGVSLTEILLKDEIYDFTVTLRYKAYVKQNVIECSSEITHNEKGGVRLENFASSNLAFDASEYWLTHFYGSWGGEMKMVEEKLTSGTKVIDSKKGVRTSQDESPSFIISLGAPLNETEGEAIIGTLAWSSNFRLSFQIDYLGKLSVVSGINNFASDYTLAAGEKLTTPALILSYSGSGMGQASRNMHNWARNYGIRAGNQPREIVLNSWEGAYFSFDDKVLKAMMDDAAMMGVEIFVLDDGWFGNKFPRDNDKAGLGDWQINYKKLPGGLKDLIDHAHSKKIKFGLWVEPEMINPKSELAEKHPEWIVGGFGRKPMLMRSQLLLDLSNPEVQKFAYDVVADVLTQNKGIDFIKWDANRHVENFGSAYLPADKQSHFWIDYTHGLYDVYEKLAKNFPNVVFEACSSGGGRVDYGSMKYHHEFWPSDNTDALSRIFINWGFNQFFPAISVASHVSQSPNHQTKHVTPIKFRFDVAMAQRLGLELQPKLLTPEELEWTKNGVQAYKGIRDVVHLGDQYRLVSPYSGQQIASMMYVDQKKNRAVMFAYSIGFHFREEFPTIKLQGLDPAKKYIIKEILPLIDAKGQPKYASVLEGKTLTGDFLMKYGIRVLIRYTYDSAVFELTEVK